MDITQFFDAQLHGTLDGFIWAASQIPEDRLRVIPPDDLGEWTATQHIFHLMHYEQKLALPSMHQWLGGPPPVRDEVNVEIWESPPPLEDMLGSSAWSASPRLPSCLSLTRPFGIRPAPPPSGAK